MRRTARKISLKDCYEILNLSKDATLEEVKHAYRHRAFELHPDLNPDDPEAGRKFQLLNEAYVALTAILKAKGQGQNQETEKRSTEKEAKQKEQSAESAGGKEERHSAEKEQTQRQEQAEKAYAEQDVLRDLLNDPFARRVFEDIYSELNRRRNRQRQKQKPSPKRNPGPSRSPSSHSPRPRRNRRKKKSAPERRPREPSPKPVLLNSHQLRESVVLSKTGLSVRSTMN